jgi:hypothetical protein
MIRLAVAALSLIALAFFLHFRQQLPGPALGHE